MRGSRSTSITIPAQKKSLTRIRRFAVKYGEKFGYNMRQVNGFKLSLDEICTNIIQYAYRENRTRGRIRIEMERSNDTVSTRIIDNGMHFDYSTIVDPDLNRYIREEKKGGLGVYLVRQLNESVNYERVGNSNILTLTNSVKPRPSFWQNVKKNLRPTRMSIKVRFALLAVFIITVITVGTFYFLTHSQLRTLTQQYLNNKAAALRNFASAGADHILNEREILLVEMVYEISEENQDFSRLAVVNSRGVVIADQVFERIGRPYAPPLGVVPPTGEAHTVQEYHDPQLGQCLYFSVPIQVADHPVGRVFLTVKKADMMGVVHHRQDRGKIAAYMGMSWVIGIIGIYFMVNMFVAPIRKIAEEIDRIGREGTTGGFHFTGVGEFAEISTAFNRMMREIHSSQARLTDQARLKREMQLAQSIQQTLLPKQVPSSEGYEIAAEYNAAMEVGGDYYDFFEVDEDTVGMTVGDVSGKGIGGAFVMSIVRTALRLEARGQKNAAEVLNRTNNSLDGEFKKGMYMTLFYIILDSNRRVINYASAGHTPMILYRGRTGQLFRMNPKGYPIGLNIGEPRMFRKHIRNERLSLSQDDLLFVYTDGITEAMNPEWEAFGEERLFNFIMEHNTDTPREFADRLLEEVRFFTRGRPQNDDITFIVIKEKAKYSDLVYRRRLRLLEMVDEQQMSVKEACRKDGLSTTTYYRLKKLRDQGGLEALRPTESEKKITVLDHTISQKILEVVVEHPEYSAKKIKDALAAQGNGAVDISTTLVYRELNRLKLSTKQKRMAYVQRTRGKAPEV
ncbi:MAG: SpoIIE family protein phosphatase [Spirochaetota bacterium]